MSSRSSLERADRDEEDRLLHESQPSSSIQKIVLPKVQLSVLLIAYLSQPVAGTIIYPFIAKLVAELDIVKGDVSKIGYYSGMFDSLPLIAEALVIMHWTRFGDQYGRKRVLLCGAVGLALSLTCFGLSRTLPTLILSRVLQGVLNANAATIKTMFGEITEGDDVAMARAFSFIPIVWASGSTLAPLIGGVLEHPADHFPRLFTARIWREYPYLLPCLAAAGVPTIAFFAVLFFLKDTLPSAGKSSNVQRKLPYGAIIFSQPSVSRHSSLSSGHSSVSTHENPTHLSPAARFHFTRTLIFTLLNCAVLVILGTSFYALISLFLAAPVSLGGAGFEPSTIGLCMSLMGIFHGTFQAFFFPAIHCRVGPKILYRVSMLVFAPLYAWMPVMNWVVRSWGGLGPAVIGARWVMGGLVVAEAVLFTMAFMGYCCMYIFITHAAPNRESLGQTNGLSQIIYSLGGALGPPLATILFAVTKENNLLGGNLIYVVMVAISAIGVALSFHLPATRKGQMLDDGPESSE